MIIDRLVLKNFKRFREEEIHFKDGITGILGNNGTGKSSIVEAIFFALYGVKATGISGDYIVSSFASPKERCEVRLDFRIGGDTYTVVRTFKKGKTTTHDATFHKDGKLVATGVSQVETEVRRTLGMGPVDFRNTVYAAQKDLLTLLEADPAKRREWFLRALGIDYLNTESQKILKERVDAKNGELQRKEGELAAMAGRQSEEEFTALQKSVTELNHTLGLLKKQHKEHDEKKKVLREEFRLFQDHKTKYTELTVKHSSLSKEKEGLKRHLDLTRSNLAGLAQLDREYQGLRQGLSPYPEKKQAFETLRKLKSEHDQTRPVLQSAERECTETRKRVELAKARIALLDQDAARRDALIAGVRKTLTIGPEILDDSLEQHVSSLHEERTHEIGTISAQLKRLSDEKKKVVSDWDTVQKAGSDGICPLCRQKLGSHYTEIREEFTSQIQRIDREISALDDKQKQVTRVKNTISSQKPVLSEIRTFTEKLKIRVTLDAEQKELISVLQIHEAACNALKQKIRDLRFEEEAYAKAEREITGLEKMQNRFNDLRGELAKVDILKKQVVDLGEQITQKQSEITQVFSEIERSAFDPKKGEMLEHLQREMETAIQNTTGETTRISERLIHTSEKIEEFKRVGARIKELRKEAKDLNDEIELLKLTRTVIADYVVYLMQVVRSRIEGEVSRIISEITGGRYEQVLLDEDFNLLVRDIDNDYTIDRFSGGEQDDIAVALRIALSRYLAELHNVHESTILIFDEIFGSQDEERRTSLLTTLRTQESRFPQIILISHIQEMQGEFANTLVVEMGTDMVSRVREVGD